MRLPPMTTSNRSKHPKKKNTVATKFGMQIGVPVSLHRINTNLFFDKTPKGNTIFGKEVLENVEDGWHVYDCDEYVSEIKYDGFL